eukprot:3557864-Pleurochrysis_carterae.AAC.2
MHEELGGGSGGDPRARGIRTPVSTCTRTRRPCAPQRHSASHRCSSLCDSCFIRVRQTVNSKVFVPPVVLLGKVLSCTYPRQVQMIAPLPQCGKRSWPFELLSRPVHP